MEAKEEIPSNSKSTRNQLKRKTSTPYRLSDFRPSPSDTLMSSGDLSLSSIIENFSQLLANRSSSFLVHVDDKDVEDISKTVMPDFVNSMSLTDEQCEVLRRMSGIDSFLPPSRFKTSDINTECPPKQTNDAKADSWDDFDKQMENSLPPKDWELIEFEDLARQSIVNSVLVPHNNEELIKFMSAEEAQQEIDKEEELRAQFMQPEDAKFTSLHDGEPSLLLDPLSITNYFQSRSSFPVNNSANDSTMLGEPIQDMTLLGPDPDIVHKAHVLIQPAQKQKEEKRESTISSEPATPISAAAVQKFLISSMSDGIDYKQIADYVLEACKKSSSSVPNDQEVMLVNEVKNGNFKKSSTTNDKKVVEKAVASTKNKAIQIHHQDTDESIMIAESGNVPYFDEHNITCTDFHTFKRNLHGLPTVKQNTVAPDQTPKVVKFLQERNTDCLITPTPRRKDSSAFVTVRSSDDNASFEKENISDHQQTSNNSKKIAKTQAAQVFSPPQKLKGNPKPIIKSNNKSTKELQAEASESTTENKSTKISPPLGGNHSTPMGPEHQLSIRGRKSLRSSETSTQVQQNPDNNNIVDSNSRVPQSQNINTCQSMSSQTSFNQAPSLPPPSQNNSYPYQSETGHQSGYSIPLSIHIHLPAFPPGMYHPFLANGSQSVLPPNSYSQHSLQK